MSKVLQPKQQLGAPTNYSLASCILLILLLLPLLQFASYALNWFPFADSGFVQLSALHYSKLVNFSSNSFVYWRQDLLLSAIAGQKYWLYMTLCYLVLASGCVLWLKQPRLWTSLTFCFLITLVLYATFALDTVVLQTCMWLPWLAVTLRKTRLAPARPALHRALFLLTCIKYLDAANQFSLLGLGIITAIEYKFDKSTWPKASKLGLVSMYACAALVTILISCPTSPRYPAQEKLVPDDGIPFTVRPHLGPELPIQVLNHAHIADSVLLPATILILFALLCLVWQKANEPYARTLAFSSLVVSICTLLHTSMFPAELNQIAPLSALSRLIPGWSFYDLTILSLCIAMLLLGVSLTLQRRFWIFGGWIAISLLAATLHQDRSGNRTHFSLLRYDIKRPWTWDSALSAPQSARHDLQTLLSPSYYAASTSEVLLRKPSVFGTSAYNFESISEFNPLLYSSHNRGSLPRLMDLRRSTRWGNGLGQQSGKEWILVKFPELRTTRALRLATGPFKTDYPQGLRISIASSCSSASSPTQRPTESGEFLRVFEQNPWQGRTLLTQHGFPYFKAPQRVLIEFSQPVTARCFLIEQIAKGAGYDWSVAEFEIDTAESMEH